MARSRWPARSRKRCQISSYSLSRMETSCHGRNWSTRKPSYGPSSTCSRAGHTSTKSGHFFAAAALKNLWEKINVHVWWQDQGRGMFRIVINRVGCRHRLAGRRCILACIQVSVETRKVAAADLESKAMSLAKQVAGRSEEHTSEL